MHKRFAPKCQWPLLVKIMTKWHCMYQIGAKTLDFRNIKHKNPDLY